MLNVSELYSLSSSSSLHDLALDKFGLDFSIGSHLLVSQHVAVTLGESLLAGR